MKTEDVLYSLFIIFVFLIMYAYGISLMSSTEIKQNWDKYKCNPAYMPFSEQLGKGSAEENMSSCMNNMSGDAMQYVLEPIEASLDVVNVLFATIVNTMNDLQNFVSSMSTSNGSMFSSVFDMFGGMTDMFSSSFNSVLDALSITKAISTVIMNIGEGVALTSESMANFICFDPNTIVKMQDGTSKFMKDIVLGDIIDNGSIVEGTLQLNNKDSKGNIKHYFYKITDDKSEQDIYVTGAHLVFDKKSNGFLRVEEYHKAKPTELSKDKLVCLITSDHKIVIGDEVFWDWEDEWFYK